MSHPYDEYAFPVLPPEGELHPKSAPGMMLRDYFATAVLTGLITNGKSPTDADIADLSYAAADKMLVKRRMPIAGIDNVN